MPSEQERLNHLPERAKRGAAMLGEVWQDALRLKSSRAVWDELRVNLGDYGNFGGLLGVWYRDHVLAGCRRLLDRSGNDVTSLVRALKLVAEDADQLTFEMLSATPRRHDDERLAKSMTKDGLSRVGCADRVDAAVIDDTVQGLVDEYRHVHRLATQQVAHRLDGQPVETVQFADVDRLLDDVLRVTQNWFGLLACVHLSTETPRVTGTGPATKALQLFDWVEYVKARAEAQHALGWDASAAEREAVEASCHLDYLFDIPEA